MYVSREANTYKSQMLQHPIEDDPDCRVEFYEVNVSVNGEVNEQNVKYWMNNNLHWMWECNCQGVKRTHGMGRNFGCQDCWLQRPSFCVDVEGRCVRYIP
ncbi:hypothetical protein AVEN_26581-1 [Araneus ventricosus]|uniref:Uncharacterized protein n=1 Tax=Araneus ventricosus TaxID=182803 RepID=A0A4Y2V5Y8_ARAVE|nr:hypothetical protein AVEN_26581-1 [Araneus ventricosus]